jgi:hypothetical protein
MVSTLRSSISVRAAIEWQRAWANSELGYSPSDEDLALLLDAQSRPEYYLREPKREKRRRTKHQSPKPRLFRLPSTII